MARKPKKPKSVETFTHEDTARRNVPTAELAVQALPLNIREKVHPVVLIDDLLRQT